MRIKPSSSRYDVQEGFEDHPSYSEPVIQFDKQSTPAYLFPNPSDKVKSRSSKKKEQTKLRFISIDRQKSHSCQYEYLKGEQQKLIHKSLTLNKEDQSFFSAKKKNKMSRPPTKLPPLENFSNSVIRSKRSQIGENLQLNQYNALQVKTLKQNLMNQGASLVFQDQKESNSHSLFKKFLKLKNCNNFLRSKYNASLLQKISTSFINPKNQVSSKLNQIAAKKPLQFISDFESSNLDFVTQINPFQYDIYIKADTNTMGHQNWFYFKLLNNSQEKKSIFMNVCNLKRGFRMMKKGQRIFYRIRKIMKSNVKTSIQNQEQEWSEWLKLEQQVSVNTVFQNCGSNNKKRKLYKLSFSSTLLSQMEYEFSLLPPFTYSEMLKQIQNLQNTCKYCEVQTLTFSLLGLCIPILTFTNKDSSNQNKNVVLLSSRIHPGQTCASYVSKGVLNKLSEQTQQNQQFLSNHIIKIIPMINPDGVVLGNFRTNYLGNDLNRSFNQQNQITFPQVIALKQLGKKLKEDYNQKFICFLDLHGHSSQKNIFVYGPNYDENHKNFINSRFLPKTLSHLSEEFDYDKCTFTLEQCKANTARGYFLKFLKTMAFTIESSYALFDSNKQPQAKNQDLKIQNWIDFGKNIVKAISIWTKSNTIKPLNKKLQGFQNSKFQIALNKTQTNDYFVIGKVKKQLNKQSLISKKRIKKRKDSSNDAQSQSSDEDTDGQSQTEDIPQKQRERLQKRIIEGNNVSLFPRILRPAIIHPEVNPPAPLFSVSKINPGDNNSVKGSIINARIKKNRYQNVKSVNVNNAYTEYLLKQVKGLQYLRPSVNLMKLSRKESSLIRSPNYEVK